MTTTTTTTATDFDFQAWVPTKGEAVYLTKNWEAHGVCAEITGVRYLDGAQAWKVSFKYRHEETGEVVKETQRIDSWRMRKGWDRYCHWFIPVAHASLAHKVSFAKAVQERAESRQKMARELIENERMREELEQAHAELLERTDIGSVECKVPTNSYGNRWRNNIPAHRRQRVFAVTLTRRGIAGFHKSLRIREYHDSLSVVVERERGVGSWKVDFRSASESSWIQDTHKMQAMLLSLMTTAASWCEMKNREEREAVAKVRAMREAVAA
jgi:hypothetical protein